MKATAQIIQIAPYGKMHVWCKKHQCRHPIDKPCDASIEAYRLEFEAEVREVDRQRKKKERAEKSNDINDRVQDAHVENKEEFEADDNFLQDNGDYSPVDMAAGRAARTRGFLYRAQQSVFAAEAENFVDLEITKEMLVATRKVVQAWIKTLKRMESKGESPPRRGAHERPDEEIRFLLDANEMVLSLCEPALAARSASTKMSAK